MREIRLYGSEGGEIEANRSSLPLSFFCDRLLPLANGVREIADLASVCNQEQHCLAA